MWRHKFCKQKQWTNGIGGATQLSVSIEQIRRLKQRTVKLLILISCVLYFAK